MQSESEDRSLRALMHQQFGEHPERVTQHRTLAPYSFVYEARLSRRTVFLKACPPDREGLIALEGWALERARETGVPVPRVLALDIGRQSFPLPYLMTEKVEGRPLEEFRPQSNAAGQVLRQLGRCLRLLHGIQVEGFGSLDGHRYLRTGVVTGRHRTWRGAALEDLSSELLYLERHGLLDSGTGDAIRGFVEKHDEALHVCRVGSLLHGDLNNSHVLVDIGTRKIAGLIDFQDVLAGDWAWDLATFAFRCSASELKYLVEGYELDGGVEHALAIRIPLYRALLITRVVCWGHKHGLMEKMANDRRALMWELLPLAAGARGGQAKALRLGENPLPRSL